VGKDSSGRPVIQLHFLAKVGLRWGTYLRYLHLSVLALGATLVIADSFWNAINPLS